MLFSRLISRLFALGQIEGKPELNRSRDHLGKKVRDRRKKSLKINRLVSKACYLPPAASVRCW